ncbi:MAG: 50S ribosomal protein L6 [Candidatus Roizmanbacteria bacterium]
MSKIGNQPVSLEGVKMTQTGNILSFTGPKGTLSVEMPHILKANVENNILTISRSGDSVKSKSLHGLFRALIANAVKGVVKEWEKRLEVVGTGFGVSLKSGDAIFKVGFSHQVTFPKKAGLTYVIEGQSILTISGIDKQLVGEAAHLVRSIRPPDAYKGKGIRYLGEVVKLKAGKKAKTA